MSHGSSGGNALPEATADSRHDRGVYSSLVCIRSRSMKKGRRQVIRLCSLLLSAGAAAVTGACTLNSFETGVPHSVSRAKIDGFSLCYSRWTTSAEEVTARAVSVASEKCKNSDGEPVLYGQESSIWNGCPLFQPVRVTFVCRGDQDMTLPKFRPQPFFSRPPE